MRDGARPRMPLESEDRRGRNPLIYVAIGCVVMFFVAVGLFVALAM